jgi:hypothetical protein
MNSTTNAKLCKFVDNRLFWAAYFPISKAADIVGVIGVLDVLEIAVHMAGDRAARGDQGVPANTFDKFLKGLSPR